jgi:shikimate dehydrogenase
MNDKYKTAGVMGWPVQHSRSPAIHNHWIKKHDLKGSYGLFEVNPNSLETALRGISALGLAGCNVTIPHKINALRFMDWIDPLAEKIGAINTVVVQNDGALHGYNFDGFGYIESIKEAQPQWDAKFSGPITMLGAGGASRAILVSLLDAGATDIRIVNRTKDKANALVDEFGSTLTAINWLEYEDALNDCELLINTTSQGMHGQSALEIKLAKLPISAIVSDVIYTPLITPLLTEAQRRGNLIVDGLGMLLHQARPAFKAWHGVMPDATAELRNEIIKTL